MELVGLLRKFQDKRKEILELPEDIMNVFYALNAYRKRRSKATYRYLQTSLYTVLRTEIAPLLNDIIRIGNERGYWKIKKVRITNIGYPPPISIKEKCESLDSFFGISLGSFIHVYIRKEEGKLILSNPVIRLYLEDILEEYRCSLGVLLVFAHEAFHLLGISNYPTSIDEPVASALVCLFALCRMGIPVRYECSIDFYYEYSPNCVCILDDDKLLVKSHKKVVKEVKYLNKLCKKYCKKLWKIRDPDEAEVIFVEEVLGPAVTRWRELPYTFQPYLFNEKVEFSYLKRIV